MEKQKQLFSSILLGKSVEEVRKECIMVNTHPGTAPYFESFVFNEDSFDTDENFGWKKLFKDNHWAFIEGLFKGCLVRI